MIDKVAVLYVTDLVYDVYHVALKEFFEKDGYQIGNEIKEKGSETYVKTLFFGNIMLEMEYKIIKCN